MLEVLRSLVARITNEHLIWLLAMAVLAVIAGLRDLPLFFAILMAGVAAMVVQAIRDSRRRSSPIRLSLALPARSAEVVIQEVRYELHDSANEFRHGGTLAFSLDVSGWICYLPGDIDATDVLRIVAIDQRQHRWEAAPFQPFYNVCVLREVTSP